MSSSDNNTNKKQFTSPALKDYLREYDAHKDFLVNGGHASPGHVTTVTRIMDTFDVKWHQAGSAATAKGTTDKPKM